MLIDNFLTDKLFYITNIAIYKFVYVYTHMYRKTNVWNFTSMFRK